MALDAEWDDVSESWIANEEQRRIYAERHDLLGYSAGEVAEWVPEFTMDDIRFLLVGHIRL